jgi:hypothetical protein
MDLNSQIVDVKVGLEKIASRAHEYFGSVAAELEKDKRLLDSTLDFDSLSPQLQNSAQSIAGELARVLRSLPALFRVSPLIGETDYSALRKSARTMEAALRFRAYKVWGPQVISDEDQILPVTPAGSSDDQQLYPSDAFQTFVGVYNEIVRLVDLVGAPDDVVAASLASSQTPIVIKLRSKTAFVMMAMDKENPKLVDLKNAVTEVFAEFGIKALRSDDIEHQDVITKRILDEIATSEFLFADLSGERPSVYYEVGYAHALGRYPILFREKGTPLHFDLAVHNCPEYSSFTELRELLRKRLNALTNKS